MNLCEIHAFPFTFYTVNGGCMKNYYCILYLETSYFRVPTSTPDPVCSLSSGYTTLNIQMLSYMNFQNTQADRKSCDGVGGVCNIIIEVCLSPIDKL